MTKKLLLIFILFFLQKGISQNAILHETSQVSVLTCGSGKELYSAFGHTAIRIKDEKSGIDVVFNYGTFDFRTENFYLKFIKGDLNYFVSATSFDDFITEYQQDERKVEEQILFLNLTQKQNLLDQLSASLFSDERYYTYKFIDRNCTTMVLDKLRTVVPNLEIKKMDDTSISYREVLYPYFQDHFWFKLGINIIFGAPTDQKATQLFLPVELKNSLSKIKDKSHNFVQQTQTIVSEKKQQTVFSFIDSIYFFITIVLLIGISRKIVIYHTYTIFIGLLGLFFCFAGLYSFHKEITWNYHVLIFNPLFLILPMIKNNLKYKKLVLFIAFLQVIFSIYAIFLPHLFLVLPIVLLNLWILYYYYNKNLNS